MSVIRKNIYLLQRMMVNCDVSWNLLKYSTLK